MIIRELSKVKGWELIKLAEGVGTSLGDTKGHIELGKIIL